MKSKCLLLDEDNEVVKKHKQNKPAWVVIKTTGDNVSAILSLGCQL